MRLIDADKLKEDLKAITMSNGTIINTNTMLAVIDKYNTAYDVDKVVEKLKYNIISQIGKDEVTRIPLDKAIEIVKGGGVDGD